MSYVLEDVRVLVILKDVFCVRSVWICIRRNSILQNLENLVGRVPFGRIRVYQTQ